MTGLVQRFRLTNEPGSLGLSCNASGLALAGVPLLRKRGDAFVPRSPFEIELLIQAAYCGTTDAARLLRGLAVVADALSQGNLAKAMIAGTLLKLPELDWNGAVRIANAEDTLSKYDPSQPRDWHRRWTIGDAGDAERSEADSVIDIAYQGKYHDIVVAEVAAHWRAQGAKVLTSVDLVGRNGATARADLIVLPPSGAPLLLVEVKTGDDPQYTDGQRVVYPMAQIGNHVASPNAKITELGFSPGE